ncbi:putative nuclease HARBI1 [Ciconia maguari]
MQSRGLRRAAAIAAAVCFHPLRAGEGGAWESAAALSTRSRRRCSPPTRAVPGRRAGRGGSRGRGKGGQPPPPLLPGAPCCGESAAVNVEASAAWRYRRRQPRGPGRWGSAAAAAGSSGAGSRLEAAAGRTLDRFKLEDVTDEYLVSTYGFPRQFIYYLVDLLGASLSRPTQRSRAISPETQILAALGFYTSGSFQTRMGDAIGISQASMSRCVANVTEALVERAAQFIHFPEDEATVQSLKDDFYGLAGMPGVLGVVDCTHVAIKAPNAEDLSYVNRKGLHSLNCLMVCDARGVLLSAETHWPGSLPDCTVLQQAALTSQFETELHKDGWLLGDSSFFLRTWLMTPLHIPETPAEYRYNMAHSATHNVIERTFRTIRSRFRCLDGSKGTLQYSPEKSSHIILACCVLHNISLEHGLDVWSSPATGHMEQPEEEYEQMESMDSEACRIRQELLLTHFS